MNADYIRHFDTRVLQVQRANDSTERAMSWQREAAMRAPTVDLNFDLVSVGLSLIVESSDLLRLSIHRVRLRIDTPKQEGAESDVEYNLKIGWAQLDNQRLYATMPVVLAPEADRRLASELAQMQAAGGSSMPDMISLEVTQCNKFKGLNYFKSFDFYLAPLSVQVRLGGGDRVGKGPVSILGSSLASSLSAWGTHPCALAPRPSCC